MTYRLSIGLAIGVSLVLIAVGLGWAAVPRSPKPVVILYTQKDPILPKLPKDCCLWVPLEKLPDQAFEAQTVIVAGHGQPPYFAEHNVHQVAKAVAFFNPELVVMNSCYGASLDILSALAEQNMDAHVIAPAFRIYYPGFEYGPAFLAPEASLMDKIKSVHTEPRYPILRWRLDSAALQKVQQQVDQMSIADIKSQLQRVQPPLLRLKFPSLFEPESEILVPVPVERFK